MFENTDIFIRFGTIKLKVIISPNEKALAAGVGIHSWSSAERQAARWFDAEVNKTKSWWEKVQPGLKMMG